MITWLSIRKYCHTTKRSFKLNGTSFDTSYIGYSWLLHNTSGYLQVLSYLERALNILPRSLLPIHPDLEDVKESLEIIREELLMRFFL